jgi:hypothetical protein
MSNFSKATIARIGRFLGGEQEVRPVANLSEWLGVPRKSIRNWMLPPDDPQHREMSPVAKRMLVLLAYFSMTGQLTKQRLADIQALERAMDDEKTFQTIARHISHVIAKANERAAPSSVPDQKDIQSDKVDAPINPNQRPITAQPDISARA